MRAIQRIALLAAGAFFATGAQSALLLSVDFSENFPFGPFMPNEAIEVIASITNTSADQTITICEGVCIGDDLTYSLGALASIPAGYGFYFGNRPTEAVFDGQIAGSLLPGQEKDFILGVYTPTAPALASSYAFATQLQIFAATPERPMLSTSTFSGSWTVMDCPRHHGECSPHRVPEPATYALTCIGLAGFLVARRRKDSTPLADAGSSDRTGTELTV